MCLVTLTDPIEQDVYIPYFGLYVPNNVTLKTLPAQVSIDALAALEPAAIAEILDATLPSKAAREAATQLAEQLVAFSAELANFQNIALVEYTADPDSLVFTTTIEAAAEAAPALVLDKVIKALAPEGCELDRMQLQLPKTFSDLSKVISKTPRSTLQSVMLTLAYANYLPYTNQATVSTCSPHPYLDKCTLAKGFPRTRRAPRKTDSRPATATSTAASRGS